MNMNEMEVGRHLIGRIPVDSGQMMLMDPCYDVPDYNSICDTSNPFGLIGDGLGAVTRTGYGDGSYEVYATVVDGGSWGLRVSKLEIIFIEDEDEDEWGW